MDLRVSEAPIFIQIRWLIDAAKNGEMSRSDAEAHFAPTFTWPWGHPSDDEARQVFITAFASLLPLSWGTIHRLTRFVLSAAARDRNGGDWRIDAEVDEADPHLILQATATPIEKPEDTPEDESLGHGWAMAAMRAAHLVVDPPPHVFQDTLARDLAGPRAERILARPPRVYQASRLAAVWRW